MRTINQQTELFEVDKRAYRSHFASSRTKTSPCIRRKHKLLERESVRTSRISTRSNVPSPKPRRRQTRSSRKPKMKSPKSLRCRHSVWALLRASGNLKNAAEGDSALRLWSLVHQRSCNLKRKRNRNKTLQRRGHIGAYSTPADQNDLQLLRASRPAPQRSITRGAACGAATGPISNDERLAYKYAELKSLLTEDFVVNADDLIDRQVEETKQVLQNYVSMRRVLGETSLDDVHARGISSADDRLRESRERTSRRRHGLWGGGGRRNEESQYNAAATVDLGPSRPTSTTRSTTRSRASASPPRTPSCVPGSPPASTRRLQQHLSPNLHHLLLRPNPTRSPSRRTASPSRRRSRSRSSTSRRRIARVPRSPRISARPRSRVVRRRANGRRRRRGRWRRSSSSARVWRCRSVSSRLRTSARGCAPTISSAARAIRRFSSGSTIKTKFSGGSSSRTYANKLIYQLLTILVRLSHRLPEILVNLLWWHSTECNRITVL